MVRNKSLVTADGRSLVGVKWRTIKEFPKYEMTVEGDIRNRETWTILNEIENPKTGAWFYSLWQDGSKHAKNRNFQGLLYTTWPELLANWAPIPNFPGYLVSEDGRVMSKRFYRELPKLAKGGFRLKRNGERITWHTGEIGNENDWDNLFEKEAA